jgi:hypothetical protein
MLPPTLQLKFENDRLKFILSRFAEQKNQIEREKLHLWKTIKTYSFKVQRGIKSLYKRICYMGNLAAKQSSE